MGKRMKGITTGVKIDERDTSKGNDSNKKAHKQQATKQDQSTKTKKKNKQKTKPINKNQINKRISKSTVEKCNEDG